MSLYCWHRLESYSCGQLDLREQHGIAVPFQLAGRLQMSTEMFQADPSEVVPALLLDSQSCRGSTLLKSSLEQPERFRRHCLFQAAAVVRGFHGEV